jgi:HEAT repeat protein
MLTDEAIGDSVAVHLRAYGSAEVSQALIPMLSLAKQDEKARIAHALGCARDQDAENELLKLTRHSKENPILIQSIRSLSEIGGPSSIPVLIDALGKGGKITEAAIEGLSRIDSDNLVVTLCERAEISGPVLGKGIVKVLAKIGTWEAINGLLNLLDITELADYIKAGLIQIGLPALEKVQKAYEDADDEETISNLREVIIDIGWTLESPPMHLRENDKSLYDFLRYDGEGDLEDGLDEDDSEGADLEIDENQEDEYLGNDESLEEDEPLENYDIDDDPIRS